MKTAVRMKSADEFSIKAFNLKILKQDHKTMTVQLWFDVKNGLKGWRFTRLVIPKSVLKSLK